MERRLTVAFLLPRNASLPSSQSGSSGGVFMCGRSCSILTSVGVNSGLQNCEQSELTWQPATPNLGVSGRTVEAFCRYFGSEHCRKVGRCTRRSKLRTFIPKFCSLLLRPVYISRLSTPAATAANQAQVNEIC